jgi:hypothetical protein
MPFKAQRISSGKDAGKYKVVNTDTGEVKARATSKENAEKQVRLLNAIENNPDFKPRKKDKGDLLGELEDVLEFPLDKGEYGPDGKKKKKKRNM